MAARVAAYLSSQPSKAAKSEAILAACGDGLSEESAPLFRQVVRAVARLRPVPGEGGKWWELRRAYWGVGGSGGWFKGEGGGGGFWWVIGEGGQDVGG